MANNVDSIKWFKQSDAQWQTTAKRTYTGTIDYLGAVANPYQLTINPGAIVSAHKTFRNAKNAFRKFLFTKPVS